MSRRREPSKRAITHSSRTTSGSLYAVRHKVEGAARRWATAGAVSALLYAGYLASIDVPMYWQRWIEQSATGHVPMDLTQGLVDLATRWTVSHRWADWYSEVRWMTAYFSVGVWCSLAIVRWPRWGSPRGQTAAAGLSAARSHAPAARATWSAKAR